MTLGLGVGALFTHLHHLLCTDGPWPLMIYSLELGSERKLAEFDMSSWKWGANFTNPDFQTRGSHGAPGKKDMMVIFLLLGDMGSGLPTHTP